MGDNTIELLVGKVGRAHGIRGDLTIEVRTDEPDRRFAPGTVFTTRRGRLTVVTARWHSGRLLVRFEEVPDRSVAETLRGTELRAEVDPDERPTDPDEFYDHQLVGLTVQTEAGDPVGQLVEVLHLPSQELFVVRRPDSGEAMIPFVTAFVSAIDLDAGRVVVTDHAGLLTEDADPAEDAGADRAEAAHRWDS